MVEQLGLAIMRCWGETECILISGTTSGTLSSMRQQDELSMTVQPFCAKRGAYWREAEAPAEKTA